MTVLYWDASAVLSVLVRDDHTEAALGWVTRARISLLSSLAAAECFAVLHRMRHEGALTPEAYQASVRGAERGPWRRVNVQPRWDLIQGLGRFHILKGADLWHLAAAKTLREDLPELRLLTFDRQLYLAAQKEGLAP
ncbi:MAG: PIN domain-containing protein [Candidatus Dadabacteria bacterium]|nr:MAG: PIN domain-containing protein [Candidatus Dadabacteria bacterium]